MREAWRERAYRRAVRRAFRRVMFYREQCAAAGRMLAAPEPTPVAQLPQPPHSLVPYARPWLSTREPSLWTPEPAALARALRIAGIRGRLPVVEVREALLDRSRLPGRLPWSGPAYRVLLSPTARVASAERRAALAGEALAVVEAAGGGWLVAAPTELPGPAGPVAPLPAGVRWVRRLPIAAISRRIAGAAGPRDTGAGDAGGTADGPTPVGTVLYEPLLGYLGALVPDCGRWHLDPGRVYARLRDGVLTLSLPRSRRPVLLDIVPEASAGVVPGRCPRHGSPMLRPDLS